jgi:predicted nucleic acid-binding protein
MELLQGARSRREMRTLQQSLQNLGFRVLPLSEAIGHVAAALIEEHALASGLQVADALIAATALEYGETLITGNARHFQTIRSLDLSRFRT